MPEPDRVCGRVSFLPSARVTMTRPPGIGRPSGAVRVGPSKYWAESDLPCAQLYWTVATGEGVWATAAPAASSGRTTTNLRSMTVSFDCHAAPATTLCPFRTLAFLDAARSVDVDIDLGVAGRPPRAERRVLPGASGGKSA